MTLGRASERQDGSVLPSKTCVRERDADEPFWPRRLERRQRFELLDRLTLAAPVGIQGHQLFACCRQSRLEFEGAEQRAFRSLALTPSAKLILLPVGPPDVPSQAPSDGGRITTRVVRVSST